MVNGDAIIYLISKATGKWTPAFECNVACIDVIKKSGKILGNENVYLIPYKTKGDGDEI